MTLNLVAAHPECIYVAADFALLDLGSNRPLVDPSMKVVQLGYRNGTVALVTYTGIGKVGQKYTADFICEWLTGQRELSLIQVAEVLRVQGTEWLRRLTPARGTPPRHTFVVAGFGTQGAQILEISNFQGTTGRPRDVADEALTITSLSAARSTQVVVTGVPNVVTRERRKLLAKTVNARPLDSLRVKSAMLGLISRAAASPQGSQWISSDGAAISILPGGSSSQTLAEPANVDLYQLIDGIQLPRSRDISAALGLGPGYKLVGGTSVQGSSAPVHQNSCARLRTIQSGDDPYEMSEILLGSETRNTTLAIDDRGRVLGTSSDPEEVGAVHYWLGTIDHLDVIPLPNPSYAVAGGLDASGRAFLSIGGHHYGPQRVTIWDGHDFRSLDAPGAYVSGAGSVSRSGWCAGYVELSEDMTRADRRHAARWNPDGRMEVAPNPNGGFGGSAVGISDDGTAALLRTALGSSPRNAIWAADSTIHELPIIDRTDLLVVGISDADVVAAVSISETGRSGVTSERLSEWAPLRAPTGWEPTMISRKGTIAGTFRDEGFMQPWVADPDRGLVKLPTYRFHHCIPKASNARGDIVGEAGGEHCVHALIWRRSERIP